MCGLYFRFWLCVQYSNSLGLRCACFYSADFSDFDNDPDWLWKPAGLIQRHRDFLLAICFSVTSLTSFSLHCLSGEHLACSLFFIPLLKQLRASLKDVYVMFDINFYKAYVYFITKCINVNKNSQRLFKKSPPLTAAAVHQLRGQMGLLTSLLIKGLISHCILK